MKTLKEFIEDLENQKFWYRVTNFNFYVTELIHTFKISYEEAVDYLTDLNVKIDGDAEFWQKIKNAIINNI